METKDTISHLKPCKIGSWQTNFRFIVKIKFVRLISASECLFTSRVKRLELKVKVIYTNTMETKDSISHLKPWKIGCCQTNFRFGIFLSVSVDPRFIKLFD